MPERELDKRVIIFAGHYGSGKTTVAVNYAIRLSYSREVVLCDLDIVNPYFKSADHSGLLSGFGIGLITSNFANTSLDAPSMPSEMNGVFDGDKTAVIDLGGDDRGSVALGRYAAPIAKAGYEMLLVTNPYRPLTGDAESLVAAAREIEEAAGLKLTGLCHNPNLGANTSREDVDAAMGRFANVPSMLGLPVFMTAVRRGICAKGEFPLDIYTKDIWNIF